MFLNNEDAKKILVLIDFDEDNSNLTANEILEKTKLELLKNLKPSDYFNIMLSNISIKKFRDNWMPATAENIDLAFNELNSSLTSYSNFSNLLGTGIEFINQDDSDSQILLITNSDQYPGEEKANELTNDLVGLIKNNKKINIVDFQEKNFEHYDGLDLYPTI